MEEWVGSGSTMLAVANTHENERAIPPCWVTAKLLLVGGTTAVMVTPKWFRPVQNGEAMAAES